MARSEPPPDPYEVAAARISAQRRGREMGEPVPELPPGTGTALPSNKLRRLLVLLAAALVVLAIGGVVRAGQSPGGCDSTKLELRDDSVEQGEVARWQASGKGVADLELRVAGAVPARGGHTGSGCSASGFFTVDSPPGSYPVTLVDPGAGAAVKARATLDVPG